MYVLFAVDQEDLRMLAAHRSDIRAAVTGLPSTLSWKITVHLQHSCASAVLFQDVDKKWMASTLI